MSSWLEGRVVGNRQWTDTLFSLRVAAPRLPFEAGQFVRIALDLGGARVARPFSFVNAPADPVLEFYGVIVPDGSLSPHLARLAKGDPLFIADNPSGFLVLSEVPPAEDDGAGARNALRSRIGLPGHDRGGKAEFPRKIFLCPVREPREFSNRIARQNSCCNPAMLKDVAAALAERGLKKHRRRAPGQITVESFW